MTSTAKTIPVAILGLLVCSPARAGQSVQGESTQGHALQGHETQGLALQGHETQGVKPQGHHIQGHETQGLALQGHETQGHETQGIVPQGQTIQGHETQGHEIQGHGTQGHALNARDARPWLQGARFVGLLSKSDHAGNNSLGALEIIGFRGDQVLALSWDGRTSWKPIELSPREFVGMTWLEHRCESNLDCERITYRISAAVPDASRNTMPRYPSNHDTWLYEIEYSTSTAPDMWRNVCQKNGKNPALGLFVDGRWNDDGSWHPGGYTFACTSGVITKCVRSWGYKPWKRLLAPMGYPVDMRPLHQACTRAARADYCGDGMSHTRNGTVIDMFDIHGFNIKESHPEFIAEAGFTPRGARWVARERWSRQHDYEKPWIALSTCRRPKNAPPAADDPVLIEVWSRRQPVLERATP